MDPITEFFGGIISAYSRAEAIDDGVLVDVTGTAREAGFTVPVAVTRAVWADCVAWDEQAQEKAYQDEAGRLWDVVYMTMIAIRGASNPEASQIAVSLYRIPRQGPETEAQPVTLTARCGSGDQGEMVITITQPGED